MAASEVTLPLYAPSPSHSDARDAGPDPAPPLSAGARWAESAGVAGARDRSGASRPAKGSEREGRPGRPVVGSVALTERPPEPLRSGGGCAMGN